MTTIRLFKRIFWIAGVAALVLFAFGGCKTVDYLALLARHVRERVDEAPPVSVEIVLADQKLREMLASIHALEDASEAARKEVAAIAIKEGETERELEALEVVLLEIQRMLEQGRSTYVVDGHRYSYREVNRDGLDKAEQYDAKLAHLELQRRHQHAMEDNLEQVEALLMQARAEHARLQRYVAQLEARDESAELRLHLAALSLSLDPERLLGRSSLSSTLESAERKIQSRLVRAGAQSGQGCRPAAID